MNLPRFSARRLEGLSYLSSLSPPPEAGALAVAVLVLVLSVANGFEAALREEVLGAVPQLVVEGLGSIPRTRPPLLPAGHHRGRALEELGALALVAQAGVRTLSRPVQVLGVAPGAGPSGLTPAQTAALRPGTPGKGGSRPGASRWPRGPPTLVVPNLRLTPTGAFAAHGHGPGVFGDGDAPRGDPLCTDDVRLAPQGTEPASRGRDVLAVGRTGLKEAALEALPEAGGGAFRFSDWRDRYGAP